MALLKKKAYILAKIETTYGTDPVPTGAANAILVRNLNVTPMDMKTVPREVVRSYLGNSENLPSAIYAKCDFEIELAGSGAAGTVPAWGVLLRACGFGETNTPATKTEYAPVSSLIESLSVYYNVDGVQHKLTGCRGTVSFSLKNDAIPTAKFTFSGIYNAVADVAAASLTLTGWIKPLPVNRINTPTFSLQSYAASITDLSIDMANTVVFRSLVGGANDSILITDRKPAGNVTMEAVTVAVKDWWTSIKAATTGALSVVHGTAAGNKVQFDAPAVQIVSPSYQDDNGIVMLQGNLVLVPSSGNDELKITAL